MIEKFGCWVTQKKKTHTLCLTFSVPISVLCARDTHTLFAVVVAVIVIATAVDIYNQIHQRRLLSRRFQCTRFSFVDIATRYIIHSIALAASIDVSLEQTQSNWKELHAKHIHNDKSLRQFFFSRSDFSLLLLSFLEKFMSDGCACNERSRDGTTQKIYKMWKTRKKLTSETFAWIIILMRSERF